MCCFSDRGPGKRSMKDMPITLPVFLSEIPSLFHDKTLPIDVALISVSPPDPHGYCSLGVSVDVVHAAARSARYVSPDQ